MNIFVLDADPYQAAEYQCDKHIPKMVLESCQMLSTAHHVMRPDAKYLAEIYKPTHTNHPCSVWVRQGISNYNWLLKHTVGLMCEFTSRYSKIHKSEEIMRYLIEPPDLPAHSTAFAQAMPDKYKSADAVQSYRNFYFHEKPFAQWQHTLTPQWYQDLAAKAVTN